MVDVRVVNIRHVLYILHYSVYLYMYVYIIIVNYLSTLSRTPGRKSLSAVPNSVWKINLFAYVHGELRASSCKPLQQPRNAFGWCVRIASGWMQ